MAELVGKTIGNKYRIVERLGRGGMAEVYKAYQPSLDRYVAVKVMHSFLAEEEDFIGRFEREGRAVARLRHSNIVQVIDFDHEGDLYYMVMEFIDGPTLKAKLEEHSRMGQPLGPKEAARILIAIGNAVDYAHRQGMVHRDLKPANIMFTGEGQPVLTDFGIAKIVGAKRFTVTGAVSGTPAYMSPEQGLGERGDERSDIYSLGVILYEMVTGRVPFDADTPFAIIMKHIQDPLPLPRKVHPQLSEPVERVILKALSKEADDRYQTAGEMARALQQALIAPAISVVSEVSAPPVARPQPPEAVVPAEKRRLPLVPLLVGGGLLLVLVAVGGYFALRPSPATPTPPKQVVVPSPTLTPTSTPTSMPTSTPTAIPPTATPTPPPDIDATVQAALEAALAARPTDTPTPIPPTDTPTLTLTPTPIAVVAQPATPTDTPTPPETPTPTPPTLRGKILFTVQNSISGKYDLYIANIDGSDQRLLYEQTRQPEFRGDGFIVANGDGLGWDSLLVMNADGSNRHPITNHPEDRQPSWSPDGAKVVHSSSQHGRRNKEGNPIWNIYIQDDASRQIDARALQIANYQVIGRSPTWLPDGRIAFNGCKYWTGEGGNCGLWAIWSDGTGVAQLTNASNDLAVDGYGNEIVFMCDQRDGNWEIYKASNVGQGITRLTNDTAIDGLPTWSPDGKRIAFLSNRGGQWAIWVMNADGSNQQKLFDLPGSVGPDWPDERISWWAP